jgi:hypothetical protein
MSSEMTFRSVGRNHADGRLHLVEDKQRGEEGQFAAWLRVQQLIW